MQIVTSAWGWTQTHWHIIIGVIVALVVLRIAWAIVRKVERFAVKALALSLAPILTGLVTTGGLGWLSHNFPVTTAPSSSATSTTGSPGADVSNGAPSPLDLLAALPIKGRAPMTGYTSDETFWDMWGNQPNGCDTREFILSRDLTNTVATWGAPCYIDSGTLEDPYTGQTVDFTRGGGPNYDGGVQIDHVVARGDAWATGASGWTATQRATFANDPSELLAVSSTANQAKGDGDAATWLPSNKDFRCQYVTIQIQVKTKYGLWVTQAEHDAIQTVLASC